VQLVTSPATLRLNPGQFFGDVRLVRSGANCVISHRIAVGAPEEVLPHTHHDAHFILVTGGRYVSAAGRAPATGDTVLVYNPPGITHRDHFERGRGSFFAVSIKPGAAAAALAELSAPDEPFYLAAARQRGIAMRIAAACALGAESLSLEALALELLGSIDRRTQPQGTGAPAWLAAALELLHDCYREDLTISQIAADVGVHSVYLARTFRRQFGCTPGQFARFRRLERSLALLMGTRLPLADVALASGFADQSHFTRVFTGCFGLPPGEYRMLVKAHNGSARRLQMDKTGLSHWATLTARAAAARANARRGR
jgi:AraC family transcriptional regulator